MQNQQLVPVPSCDSQDNERKVSSTSQSGGRKLHVVTVLTHADGYFPALCLSARLLNVDLKILGWGEKWGGFRWKLLKVSIARIFDLSHGGLLLNLCAVRNFLRNYGWGLYTEEVQNSGMCENHWKLHWKGFVLLVRREELHGNRYQGL